MIRYVLGGICAVAVGSLYACATVAGVAARPAAMAGTWVGEGVQTPVEPDSRWPLRVVLNPAGDGAIAYPTLGCGGPLTRLRSIGNTVVYREVITYGADTCVVGGTVTMVRDGGRLFWYWTGDGTDEPEISATAVLRRVGD